MKIGDVGGVAHGRPASLADLWRRVWRARPAGNPAELHAEVGVLRRAAVTTATLATDIAGMQLGF